MSDVLPYRHFISIVLSGASVLAVVGLWNLTSPTGLSLSTFVSLGSLTGAGLVAWSTSRRPVAPQKNPRDDARTDARSYFLALEPALTPQQWIARHKLTRPDGTLDSDQVEAALERQLGLRWHELWRASATMRAAAILCVLEPAEEAAAPGLRDKVFKAALEARDDRADDGLRRAFGDLWENPAIKARVEAVARPHGYASTALVALVEAGRRQGRVLGSAEFLWLKARHRHLFYAVDAVGRSKYRIEALGTMVHYAAEKTAGKDLGRPDVRAGVRSLEKWASLEAGQHTT